MNNRWISDSYESAAYFRRKFHNRRYSKLRLITILDVVGMFETGWLIYNHSNTTKYKYPK